ncbi:hypothetical protein HMPREF1367_03065 [Enterococcus faecium ERV38]|nr:hypothetical protein HMPREF1381_02833 [Enterococcus faecium R501]EJX82173.1 hypothetical protein HMPREF1368_02721 [Enterococcus faecium ERV69]EJX85309.1 hypothetical protein HMPREF1367_03065 [Enterococcus faecium ERV38]EJY15715.1 hypothetical protein HMPREF1359_00252 [Enterococcus faecium E417]EJY40728.1 hypothetical protein HMPREF1351_00697 [Enterococcus faecium 510]EJY48462.1 hypothetical protein HMPREF1349_00903 [Enterococcus faecium 506]
MISFFYSNETFREWKQLFFNVSWYLWLSNSFRTFSYLLYSFF